MPSTDSRRPARRCGAHPDPWTRGAAGGRRRSRTASSGTLMRNTEPHQKCSTRNPEIGGPRAAPPAAMPAHAEIAFERSSGGNTLVSNDRVEGITSTAARPITARGADHLTGAVRERREHGAGEEQHHAALQHELAAEAVADRAGGEQHPGEHEAVGVHHPLQRAGRRVEVVGELGRATLRLPLAIMITIRLRQSTTRIFQRLA